MRIALAVAPLLVAFAFPAQAQSAEDEDIWTNDPYAENDEMVLAIDTLMDALLDMPIGRLVDAVPEADIGREVRADDTLRDLATREDPNFEENMRGGARMMTGMLGHMMSRMGDLMPVLEEMGERVGEALPARP